jgi:soluble lytic murein transglycosylase-like protein
MPPWLTALAALAIAGTGCAGGAPTGVPLPMPSPSPAPPAADRASSAAKAGPKRTPAAQRKPDPSAKSPAKAKAKPADRPTARPPARAPAPPPLGPSVDSTALEFAVTARLAHEPLARAIARRTRNPELAERAAWAVTREAGRLRMSPSLLAAVLLVENRQLDSAAVSSQGAIGLMQVMPIHAGSYGCASADLATVDANICHGARILHLYVTRSRSITVALRRYNGCVRGTNTPRCSRYPMRVLQTAARLRRDILANAVTADQRIRT